MKFVCVIIRISGVYDHVANPSCTADALVIVAGAVIGPSMRRIAQPCRTA